jgi:hypothetical protein
MRLDSIRALVEDEWARPLRQTWQILGKKTSLALLGHDDSGKDSRVELSCAKSLVYLGQDKDGRLNRQTLKVNVREGMIVAVYKAKPYNVVKVPRVEMSVELKQMKGAPLVEAIVTTKFSDEIDLSLHMHIYAHISAIVGEYSKPVASTKSDKASSARPRGSRRSKVFHVSYGKEHDLQPKIRHLGEATPPTDKILSYFGLDKDHPLMNSTEILYYIHNLAIEPVCAGMFSMSSVLTQLEEQIAPAVRLLQVD